MVVIQSSRCILYSLHSNYVVKLFWAVDVLNYTIAEPLKNFVLCYWWSLRIACLLVWPYSQHRHQTGCTHPQEYQITNQTLPKRSKNQYPFSPFKPTAQSSIITKTYRRKTSQMIHSVPYLIRSTLSRAKLRQAVRIRFAFLESNPL